MGVYSNPRTFDPLVHQIGLALKAELEAGESTVCSTSSRQQQCLPLIYSGTHSVQKHNLCQERTGKRSRRRLQPVIDYMHTHLEQNLSLAEVAAVVQMSTFYFARSFKQAFGVTPYQYLLQCRIEKAKQLLHWQDLSRLVATGTKPLSRSISAHHFRPSRSRGVVPAATEQLLAVRPDATYSLHDKGGHAPHWDSEHFERELAEFALGVLVLARTLTIRNCF